MAVMETAKSPGLVRVHLPIVGKAGSPATAVKGGSRGQVATLVTMTVTVAPRAETRTPEVTHGSLHTGTCLAHQLEPCEENPSRFSNNSNRTVFHPAERTTTDTTGEVLQRTITAKGGRSPTGTRIEIPGMDAGSLKVCMCVVNEIIWHIVRSSAGR